jgi:hypothetical protein
MLNCIQILQKKCTVSKKNAENQKHFFYANRSYFMQGSKDYLSFEY